MISSSPSLSDYSEDVQGTSQDQDTTIPLVVIGDAFIPKDLCMNYNDKMAQLNVTPMHVDALHMICMDVGFLVLNQSNEEFACSNMYRRDRKAVHQFIKEVHQGSYDGQGYYFSWSQTLDFWTHNWKKFSTWMTGCMHGYVLSQMQLIKRKHMICFYFFGLPRPPEETRIRRFLTWAYACLRENGWGPPSLLVI